MHGKRKPRNMSQDAQEVIKKHLIFSPAAFIIGERKRKRTREAEDAAASPKTLEAVTAAIDQEQLSRLRAAIK